MPHEKARNFKNHDFCMPSMQCYTSIVTFLLSSAWDFFEAVCLFWLFLSGEGLSAVEFFLAEEGAFSAVGFFLAEEGAFSAVGFFLAEEGAFSAVGFFLAEEGAFVAVGFFLVEEGLFSAVGFC